MTQLFVMSDIHSFYDEMMLALKEKQFDKDNPDHVLVVCGDLFDRGPKSKEVLEFVQSLPEDRFIYIRGNHEDLLEVCVSELIYQNDINQVHVSNGTLKTIMQLCDLTLQDLADLLCSDEDTRSLKLHNIFPVLKYIHDKCVDYAEVGDAIFVHGWIPCHVDEVALDRKKKYTFDEDWNKHRDDGLYDMKRQNRWSDARWINGLEAWQRGIRLPDKTIVCGHWHCSWGWSHIDQKRKEFPQKNSPNWLKSFEPYIKEGIIALDACTAWSGICNCVVLEIEEEE